MRAFYTETSRKHNFTRFFGSTNFFRLFADCYYFILLLYFCWLLLLYFFAFYCSLWSHLDQQMHPVCNVCRHQDPMFLIAFYTYRRPSKSIYIEFRIFFRLWILHFDLRHRSRTFRETLFALAHCKQHWLRFTMKTENRAIWPRHNFRRIFLLFCCCC